MWIWVYYMDCIRTGTVTVDSLDSPGVMMYSALDLF